MVLHGPYDRLCQLFAPRSTVGVHLGDANRLRSTFVGGLGDGGQFSIRIGEEAVDGDHDGDAKGGHITDVSVEIGFGSKAGGLHVFRFKRGFVWSNAATVSKGSTVEFHRAYSDVHDHAIGRFSGSGRFDVHEFLSTHVRAKACLGHHDIC